MLLSSDFQSILWFFFVFCSRMFRVLSHRYIVLHYFQFSILDKFLVPISKLQICLLFIFSCFSHSASIDQLFSLSRFNPLLIFDLYCATLLPVFKFCVKTHFRFRFSIFQRRWLFYNLHNTGCIVCCTNRMERTEVITEISW